jgi:hypothetical protein
MATKKPKPLSQDCGTKPPETRLTWDELARLSVIVSVDLRLLELISQRQAPGDDIGLLETMIQNHKDIIAKLKQMRTEAYRREHP